MIYKMTIKNPGHYDEIALTYTEWDDVRNAEDLLRLNGETLTITVEKIQEPTGLVELWDNTVTEVEK